MTVDDIAIVATLVLAVWAVVMTVAALHYYGELKAADDKIKRLERRR